MTAVFILERRVIEKPTYFLKGYIYMLYPHDEGIHSCVAVSDEVPILP
jgi:hypothetical protein